MKYIKKELYEIYKDDANIKYEGKEKLGKNMASLVQT